MMYMSTENAAGIFLCPSPFFGHLRRMHARVPTAAFLAGRRIVRYLLSIFSALYFLFLYLNFAMRALSFVSPLRSMGCHCKLQRVRKGSMGSMVRIGVHLCTHFWSLAHTDSNVPICRVSFGYCLSTFQYASFLSAIAYFCFENLLFLYFFL